MRINKRTALLTSNDSVFVAWLSGKWRYKSCSQGVLADIINFWFRLKNQNLNSIPKNLQERFLPADQIYQGIVVDEMITR